MCVCVGGWGGAEPVCVCVEGVLNVCVCEEGLSLCECVEGVLSVCVCGGMGLSLCEYVCVRECVEEGLSLCECVSVTERV